MSLIILVQFMHGILVDNTLLVAEEICGNKEKEKKKEKRK